MVPGGGIPWKPGEVPVASQGWAPGGLWPHWAFEKSPRGAWDALETTPYAAGPRGPWITLRSPPPERPHEPPTKPATLAPTRPPPLFVI